MKAMPFLAISLCMSSALPALGEDRVIDITPERNATSRSAEIVVPRGSTAQIDLQFNAGTPGTWKCSADHPETVALADLGIATDDHPKGMVGFRQRQRFSLTALSTGSATVTCGRIFLKETALESVLTVEVQ